MFSVNTSVTSSTIRPFFAAILASALLALPAVAAAKNVMIETPLGDIEIELLEADAPNTVANFMQYVDGNRYKDAFIHRSIKDFVIQGGGFTFNGTGPVSVETFDPVVNEFKVSNTRGTVAMAKLSGQPDSATSQWFINLVDNTGLDTNNGGFTVFARVVAGMDVAEAIAELPTVNAGGAFTDMPVIDFSGGVVTTENLVITTLYNKDTPPEQPGFVMNAGLNDAWWYPLTDGQGFFINVFPDLKLVSLAWFTYDTELPGASTSANLGDAGHRWLTALGSYEGDTAVMNIEMTSGGLFDAASTIERTDPPGSDGTITLSFTDCGAGLVEYDIKSINQQGSVPIQRVANDNVALCEALIEE